METTQMLDKIYLHGIENLDWNLLLDLISTSFRSQGAIISALDKNTLNSEILGSYFSSGIHNTDFLSKYLCFKHTVNIGSVTSINKKNLFANIDLTANENLFFNNTSCYCLGVINDEQYSVCLILFPEQGELSHQQMSSLKTLHPHLKRILLYGMYVVDLKEKNKALLSSLEKVPHGIITVDYNLKVLFKNTISEKILNGNFGITFNASDNALRCIDDNEQKAFKSCIEKLLKGKKKEETINIHSRRSKFPITLNITAHPKRSSSNPPYKKILIIHISHPEVELFNNKKSLIDTFNLTNAEASLALEIANGATIQGISEEMNKSIQTVRSQLKSVFLKMNVNSQTELVRHILTSSYHLID